MSDFTSPLELASPGEFGAETVSADVEGRIAEDERATVILRVVDSQPERRRNVFVSIRQEKLTRAQAAERFGISVNTVNAHLTTVTTAIRDALARYQEEGR